ncbi:MAG: MFS transporter [Anaerolineaceae bacterium]|nr:MFS transporter [Anaerolineaceae bacterium]
MIKKLKLQYFAFPRPFRILVASTFIDRLGGALIFPFLSLYVAQKFNVGMTEIGLIFGLWSISSLVGSMVGGALSDKFGRKAVIIFGLVSSAVFGILMGLINNLSAFYLLALVAGIFSDIGHPAQQAMVADLLQGEQRTEGFGVLRVIANLAITFGPAIGGVLAGVSYLLLFIIDACTSSITALIVLWAIPETKPDHVEGIETESLVKTIIGYREVVKDKMFMAFIFAIAIIISVYTQMYSTLPVFLNRVHGVAAKGFGYMMSMNAAMVVLFQMWITKRIKKYSPMLMMILASALYGIGFILFGFVSANAMFFVGMAIITVGEMVHMPVAQSLAAFFAPEEMRGRYMAIYGLGWAIPNSIAPFLAGLVMDNLDPYWVWYFAGILAVTAVFCFGLLQYKVKDRFTAHRVTNLNNQ